MSLPKANGQANGATKKASTNGAKLAKPDGTADSVEETAVLVDAVSPTSASGGLERTSGLSQVNSPLNTGLVKGRKIAILAAEGVSAQQVEAVKAAAKKAGVTTKVIGPHLGTLTSTDGAGVEVDRTIATSTSIMFDAVFVPGGAESVAALLKMGDIREFVDEAFKHAKPIAASGEGVQVLAISQFGQLLGLKPGTTNTSSGQINGWDRDRRQPG